MSEHQHQGAEQDPKQFWEAKYADQVWSGKVNATLQHEVATWPAGTALDLGCGEGGDVIWLAQQGWQATGVDLSEAAIGRAREAAAGAGLSADQARFIAADLATLQPGEAELGETFDLVTASFLQAPVELPRAQILRTAAGWVGPGGHLLITAHAAPPPWVQHSHEGDPAHESDSSGAEHHHVADFRHVDPTEEVAALGLPDDQWQVLTAEIRRRAALSPTGEASHLLDSVVLLRRLG